MLEIVRMHLHCYWLALHRDLKRWFTPCKICRKYGASPCSICAGINLCDHCQFVESIKLDRRLHGEAFNEEIVPGVCC